MSKTKTRNDIIIEDIITKVSSSVSKVAADQVILDDIENIKSIHLNDVTPENKQKFNNYILSNEAIDNTRPYRNDLKSYQQKIMSAVIQDVSKIILNTVEKDQKNNYKNGVHYPRGFEYYGFSEEKLTKINEEIDKTCDRLKEEFDKKKDQNQSKSLGENVYKAISDMFKSISELFTGSLKQELAKTTAQSVKEIISPTKNPNHFRNMANRQDAESKRQR